MTDPTFFPSGSAFVNLAGRPQVKVFAVDDSVSPAQPGYITKGVDSTGQEAPLFPAKSTVSGTDLVLVFDPNTGAASKVTAVVFKGKDGTNGTNGKDGTTTSHAVSAVAASGANQALTWPAAGGASYYDITLNANCTVTLTGATAGIRQTVIALLRQDGTGGRTLTLPGSIIWTSGSAPSLNSAPAGAVTRVELETFDGGVTILGRY